LAKTKEIIAYRGNALEKASAASGDRAGWFLGGMLFLALGLLPVYIFSSGGPQLVDGPLLILMAAHFLRRSGAPPALRQNITPLLPFLIWAVLVNSVYFIIYPWDFGLPITTAQILYTFLIFLVFSSLLWDFLEADRMGVLYAGMLLSFLLIFTVKGHSEEGIRSELSFNNPNQLGYYALLLACLAALFFQVKKKFTEKKVLHLWGDGVVLFMAHVLMLLSLSRGALLGLFFVDVWLFPKLTRRLLVMFLPLLLLVVIVLAWQPEVLQERLAGRPGKSLDQEEITQEVHSRILRRLYIMEGIHYLVGRGGRSGALQGIGEVHNIFGDIFRSYGIIGLGLFGYWLGGFIWRSRQVPGALFIWAALLTYNMSHYGLRFRAFWVVLAFLNVMLILETRNREEQATEEPRPGQARAAPLPGAR